MYNNYIYYIEMSYDEFWRIVDTFRDERFWKIRDNKLYKFNI